LPNNINKTIVFEKDLRYDSIKISNKLLLNNYKNLHIIWQKDETNNSFSHIDLYNDYNQMFSIPLNKFYQNSVDEIIWLNDTLNTITENSDINFSYYTEITSYGASLFIKDIIGGDLYCKNVLNQASSVCSLTDSLNTLIYKARGKDKKFYDDAQKLLRKLNVVDINTIARISINNDTLYVLAQNIMPSFVGNDTLLEKQWSVLEYSKSELINIYPIVYDRNALGNYSINPIGFFCNSQRFFLTVTKIQRDASENYFIGEFVLKDGIIKYEKTLPDTLPGIYKATGLYYNGFTPIASWPYYIVYLSNTLFNVEDPGHPHILKNLFLTDLHYESDITHYLDQRTIFDVKIDGNFNLHAIIFEQQKYYYVFYDIKRDSVIARNFIGNSKDFVSLPKIDNLDLDYVYMCPDKNYMIRKKVF